MTRKNLICVIIFLLTATFLLADRSSLPVVVHNDFDQTSTVAVKSKEDKCVKPFSKIKKVKLKIRYKAGEVKFALDPVYVYRARPMLIVETVPVNHQYHLATGFHFTKKLRGPPAVI